MDKKIIVKTGQSIAFGIYDSIYDHVKDAEANRPFGMPRLTDAEERVLYETIKKTLIKLLKERM